MPHYIRAYVPDGSYFFTAALLERRRCLLTEHVDALRAAFISVQRQRPFRIDAIVVLPDHLHCLWTLPPDDADYSKRWGAIKKHFTQSWLAAGGNEQPLSDSRHR
jgi:putative transposase